MKWTTATLTLLTSGTLLLAGQVLLRPDRATPEEILARVQLGLQQEVCDEPLLLRDITRALRDSGALSGESINRDLTVRMLCCRADLYARVGDYGSARADIQGAIDEAVKPPADLLLRSIELEAASGEVLSALDRARDLNRDLPELHAGWALTGSLAREEARARLEAATAIGTSSLVHEDAEEATGLMANISARDRSGDPRRLRHAAQLRSLFLPNSRTELQKALALLDGASDLNQEARTALTQSMAGDPNEDATVALLQLYQQAGHDDLAAELGRTALMGSALSSSEAVYHITLESLTRLGQDRRASQLAQSLPWSQMRPGKELSLQVATLFFRSGEWKKLSRPADRLVTLQDRQAVDAALFFDGFAHSAHEKWGQARDALTNYTQLPAPYSPVPFARHRAHLQLARIFRALKQPQQELEHLGSAIGAPADESTEAWLAEVNADEFLRFKDLGLEIENVGYRKPEEYITRAMSLSPERTEDLMADWEKMGTLSLERAGFRFDELLSSMRARGLSTPHFGVGPWALYRIGEAQLEGSNPTAALTVARKLLDRYPHLLPALDLSIRCQLELGSRTEVLDSILLRIELVGSDPQSADYLRMIRAGEVDAVEGKRLVLRDPAGRGRREVANHLLARNEPARSLAATTPPRAPEAPGASTLSPAQAAVFNAPHLRLARARALNDLTRYGEASDILTGLLDEPALGSAALLELVEAQLGSGREEALDELVTHVLRALSTGTPQAKVAALQVADHLLAGGQPNQAARLLAGLDSSPALRGGDVLERLALGAALSGDAELLAQVLERAEAFLDDGGADTIRILYAIENRSWTELPDQVAALRASGGARSNLEETLLNLLGERLEAGLEQARAGVELNPHSGPWTIALCAALALSDRELEVPKFMGAEAAKDMELLLHGIEGARRDPREVLGLLLAVRRDGWGTWAVPRILEIGQKGGGVLWPTFLGALAQDSLGQHTQSRSLYASLTRSFPTFGPGWDGLEARLLASTEDPISKDALRIRAARAKALGRSGLRSELDSAVDRAARMHLAGKNREAVKVLQDVLAEGETGHYSARVLLARLRAEVHDYRQAARDYALALAGLPGTTGHPLLEEYLGMLTESRNPKLPDAQRLGLGEVALLLESQAEHFSADPLIPYERARIGMEMETRNATLAVEMAGTLFLQFRRNTAPATLESLRPGSARLWAMLLTRLNPSLAERFLNEDLEVTPGDVDLWHLLADVYASQERRQEERDLRETIVMMCPEARARHELAWVLLRTGAPMGRVAEQLGYAQVLMAGSPSAEFTDRASFIRNLAALERPDGRGISVNALRALRKLWARHRQLKGVDVLALGRSYAMGLLRHGTQEDLKQLPIMLGQLAASPDCDPYTHDYSLAMSGLARQVQARGPRREAPDETVTNEQGAGAPEEPQVPATED